jgi:hypothetical protein
MFGGFGFDEHELYFLSVVRPGAVLNAFGNDEYFAWFHGNGFVPEIHHECAADHHEQFIFAGMAMPYKFTVYFCQLYVVII